MYTEYTIKNPLLRHFFCKCARQCPRSHFSSNLVAWPFEPEASNICVSAYPPLLLSLSFLFLLAVLRVGMRPSGSTSPSLFSVSRSVSLSAHSLRCLSHTLSSHTLSVTPHFDSSLLLFTSASPTSHTLDPPPPSNTGDAALPHVRQLREPATLNSNVINCLTLSLSKGRRRGSCRAWLMLMMAAR